MLHVITFELLETLNNYNLQLYYQQGTQLNELQRTTSNVVAFTFK